MCASLNKWAREERLRWETKWTWHGGLGINGCITRDRKNKVQIDKARGWRKLKENKWEGRKESRSSKNEIGLGRSGKKTFWGLRALGSGSEDHLSWSEKRRGFGKGSGERDTVKCCKTSQLMVFDFHSNYHSSGSKHSQSGPILYPRHIPQMISWPTVSPRYLRAESARKGGENLSTAESRNSLKIHFWLNSHPFS